jgi:hypothetical protein
MAADRTGDRFPAGGDMRSDFRSWLTGPSARQRRGRRPRSRLGGCLLLVLLLALALVVISLLFGGFRTGTRVGSSGPPASAATSLRG